jgi:hypothetical protein
VLFHERWEVDVTLDEFKVHQRLLPRPLRSLSPVGVIQELYAALLAHFVVCSIMHQAPISANLDPDNLSFVESVHLIRASIAEFQMVDSARHDRLYQRLLRDITRQSFRLVVTGLTRVSSNVICPISNASDLSTVSYLNLLSHFVKLSLYSLCRFLSLSKRYWALAAIRL